MVTPLPSCIWEILIQIFLPIFKGNFFLGIPVFLRVASCETIWTFGIGTFKFFCYLGYFLTIWAILHHCVWNKRSYCSNFLCGKLIQILLLIMAWRHSCHHIWTQTTWQSDDDYHNSIENFVQRRRTFLIRSSLFKEET